MQKNIQKFEIKNQDSFKLKDIFECGQCFRWNEENDGSYTGVWKNNVVNVKQNGKDITFEGVCLDGNIEDEVKYYFDLDRNYEDIKRELSNIDENMSQSIKYGEGIRILNQDLWETIISFIISANNNIPRIKGIIERISKKYGKKIIWHNKEYYTFPNEKELSMANVQDLRKLGLGFRDIRVYNTTRKIMKKEVNLDELKKEKDTKKVRDILLSLDGVGPKVADCILLFSDLKRLDVFPIDVWVRRVMNELYIKQEDESKVSKKLIEKIAYDKYGNLSGIAQQYLFYWKREA